ncbi:hypothetical protein ACFLZ2_04555 [Candidatus Margulisiibacteriota bacterium]
MKNKLMILVLLTAVMIAVCAPAYGVLRTYRQFKDVSVMQDGNVRTSTGKANLFEYQYNIDLDSKTITRIKVRRLDEANAKDDATVYTITEVKKLHGSKAGRGGKVIVAVSMDGNEIIELGSKFAFTTRTSPFSQVISGVYKRVYTAEDREKWQQKKSSE